MEITEFPSIDVLVNSVEKLGPADRERVENWRTLSPELQAMVPYVAQLIVEGMGGEVAWRDMTEAERNIMGYTAVALLAQARKLAQVASSASGLGA